MSAFDDKLRWGGEAERAVSLWLQRRGWYVLPTYDYSGEDDNKAPKLEGQARSLVIPDLLAAQFSHGSCWLEVKRKTKADYTYTTGRHETGISLRLWNDYKDVAHESGIDASVIFVHEREDQIRAGRIRTLNNGSCRHGLCEQPIRRDSSSPQMGRMVFFCWECLGYIAQTSEVLRGAPPIPRACFICGNPRVRRWCLPKRDVWYCANCEPFDGAADTDWLAAS